MLIDGLVVRVHAIDARDLARRPIQRSVCVHVTWKVSKVWISPTLEKKEEIVGFIRPDDLKG